MKSLTFLLATLLAGTACSSAQIAAGPITNNANGHHYYLLSGTNWNAAEALAVSLGGHLATRPINRRSFTWCTGWNNGRWFRISLSLDGGYVFSA